MVLADSKVQLTEREMLEKKIQLLEQQKFLEENLPHLYGWPWYEWAYKFFTSTNRYNFLCAANQISKSSTQIRKCIHWATSPEMWPKLWKSKPTQFWYFYPSLDVATAEFEEKWIKEFLPTEALKDHPLYGWKATYKAGKILKIAFNSGVTVYFKSYEQKEINLQTASVYAVFVDEEMPSHLYSEVNARISAPLIRGYWHMVFTATLGQEMWRLTIEEKGKHELFKNAFKQQISIYDCKKYMDGSPGPWTDEMIQEQIDSCSTEAEVQRRVFGRFVIDVDRKYPSFSRSKCMLPDHPIPKKWLIYAGVDIGSGGQSGHPGAIAFVGVSPDFTEGRVFKVWRGDKIDTTSGDLVEKYMELAGKMRPAGMYYDSQSRDFYNIAQSKKLPFQKADKGHDTGTDLLNTLFKNDMLKVYENDEAIKLAIELEGLKTTTPKPQAKDDLIDAVRFAVTRIPWDHEAAAKKKGGKKPKKEKPEPATQRERDWEAAKERKSGLDLLEAEIDLANLAYDYGGGGPDDGFGGDFG